MLYFLILIVIVFNLIDSRLYEVVDERLLIRLVRLIVIVIYFESVDALIGILVWELRFFCEVW